MLWHDDVIKWKHFPRYWPFVRGIHRSSVNSPHKGQWCGALMYSLIYAWINGWVNNRKVGDLRRHRPHFDVIVMYNVMSNFSERIWESAASSKGLSLSDDHPYLQAFRKPSVVWVQYAVIDNNAALLKTLTPYWTIAYGRISWLSRLTGIRHYFILVLI